MSDDRFEELDEIVRREYETGEFDGTHLLMPPSLWERVRARRPVPEPRQPWMPADPFAVLHSIPVVLDEGVAAGEWRLVDRAGDVVRQGVVAGADATADDFYEDDEDPAEVWAAFERGEKRRTRSPSSHSC